MPRLRFGQDRIARGLAYGLVCDTPPSHGWVLGEVYVDVLRKSVFTLSPAGTETETFRMLEALETEILLDDAANQRRPPGRHANTPWKAVLACMLQGSLLSSWGTLWT